MDYGLHISISGKQGFAGAALRAGELGVTAMQIFVKSPRAWKLKSMKDAEAERFREARTLSGIDICVIHASYLVNLGAMGELWEKSVFSLADDLAKARMLSAEYVVVHPGSGDPERIKEGVLKALSLSPSNATLLMENIAGSGHRVGQCFEKLAILIEGTPFGVCLDTAHAFSAGYPLHENPEKTLDELDQVVGLVRVPVIHFNDTRGEFASGVDHHANLGEGRISGGLERLLQDPRLAEKTFIMETPGGYDALNLRIFRRWAGLKPR